MGNNLAMIHYHHILQMLTTNYISYIIREYMHRREYHVPNMKNIIKVIHRATKDNITTNLPCTANRTLTMTMIHIQMQACH